MEINLVTKKPSRNALQIAAIFTLGLLVLTSVCDAQILHKKKKVNKSTAADNTAEPDKVLYERSLADIQHGKQEVGRLGMQTLINTYPDSDFLAKAKLAIADSYYKEGGSGNLTQAIQGYKDFIVFFPFLAEAPYAQLQVANAHYRQLAKPDRDRTQAKLAEDEYQVFLEKYPHDPLAPQAEQKLRNIQEIIAEGDYRIGYFYYVKGSSDPTAQRAAAARFASLAQRYPLYSKSDKALWMLGQIYEKNEHREIASLYYAQIVRNYPLSSMAPTAKNKLVAFKVPVPQADPTAVAWMKAEQNVPRQHETFVKKPGSLLHSGPRAEIMAAARSGAPNLQPENDTTSATDILRGGGHSQMGSGGSSGNGGIAVETVTPGTAATSPSNPASGSTEAAPSSTSPAPAAAPAPGTPAPATPTVPPASVAADPNAPPSSTPAGTAPAATSANPASSTAPDTAQSGDNSNQKESSSKKKKKIWPF